MWKKGVVFTLEALITFTFFLISVASLYLLIQQKQNTVPLYETVILNDVYQVLELKYHTDLSSFARTGQVSNELRDYLNYVKDSTGHIIFLKFGNFFYSSNNSIPCTPLISQKRLLVYFDLAIGITDTRVNYFHELTIGLCK
ncbi:MAG: hypothetical protein QXO35_02335 [Candidatus Micrarchaeia archaeon]